MLYIYIYSPWIYFNCPFWESLVTYQYHGMGYRFTQMTGGVRSFLTFMPSVLLGGSLACSFLGQPIFLFKGVIMEADTPLERFTWALNLLWKCLDHLDSHKSHLKREISVVIHSQRDQPDVIMSLLYRFNMWHPIALVDGPMTPCFRTI